MESRESLIRDGAFETPRRDSFIRDEFGPSQKASRNGAAARNSAADDFYSEAAVEASKAGGLQLQRTEILLAVVVIALVVGGVSVWTLMDREAAPPPSAPVETATAPPQAVPETPVPATSPNNASQVAARPAPRAVVQASRQPVGNSVRPAATASSASRSAARPTGPAQPQANVLTPTLVADTPVNPATGGPAASSARAIDAGGLNRVYSSSDADVVPPKMVVEDLPVQLIVGMPTRMQAVELMVTEQGDVSRVRLLTEQRRILDTLILSRAKMWKFTPALRQGRPVPYRLVVNWETND